MDRINHASAPGGFWTNGNPSDPATGTVPQATWFNDVQEELRNIISAAGLTPTAGAQTQLLASLLMRAASAPDMYRTMGNGLIFDVADDATARISETGSIATDDCRLIMHFANFRLYLKQTALSEQLWFAYDASYNNATSLWVDGGNGRLWLLELSTGSLVFYPGIVAGAPAGPISLTLSSSIASVGKNVLAPQILPSARGSVSLIDGTAALTNYGGVASVAATTPASGIVTVTWLHAFASASYYVGLTPSEETGAGAVPILLERNAGNCLVRIKYLSTGANASYAVGGVATSFMIDASGVKV